MSSKLEIRLDEASLREAEHMLDGIKGGMDLVRMRAINKTATGVRTDMVTLIRTEYNYKAAAIRKRISIKKATKTSLGASVESKGTQVHLTDVAGTRQTKKGVSVDVKKSTGRHVIPHAFINTVPGGKKIVMIRKRDASRESGYVARYPVEDRRASHPEVVYNTDENWKTLSGKANERLQKNFEHEVDYLLSEYNGQ